MLSYWRRMITGPDLRVEVGGVTDAQVARGGHQALHEGVVDVVVDVEAVAGLARLPLVEERAEEGAVDRDVQVGVGADDVRRLAAQLQGHLLDRRGGHLEDLAGPPRSTR